MYPPSSNLRPSLVRAAVADRAPRRQPNFQWMAVAAAIVLAALVVVGLMSSRITNRSTVAPPKASPSGDYGNPPAEVPLVYAADPNHPGWYVGFDWTGTPRGTIKLQEGADPNSYLKQSADGSMFLITPAAKGGTGQYLDRLGRPIAGASTYLPLQMWADNGRQYCALATGPGPRWSLSLNTPGSAAATTNGVVLDSPNLTSGVIAIGLVACSPAHDRAVLVYNYFPRPPEVWVVRISDGKVLQHHLYDTTYSDVAASPDTTLVAVNSAASTGYLAGPVAAETLVTRSSDGSVVARLNPSYEVLAFSADDSQALVATSPYVAGVKTHLATVDLASGNVIWQYIGDQELSGFQANPAGAGFAVMLQTPSDQSAHPSVSLMFVSGTGQEHDVPGSYLRP